jgi:uncharacterized protein YjiS (DUF1127 family)
MTIAHSADGFGQTIKSGKRASFFKGCWRAFQEWRERERLRAELFSLNDRELRDIGITHGEIDYFVSNRTVDPLGI